MTEKTKVNFSVIVSWKCRQSILLRRVNTITGQMSEMS